MLRYSYSRFFLAPLCSLMLATCSSPSSSTFALSSSGLPISGKHRPVHITVGDVSLPKYLDRPQMVSHINSVELKVDEFSRWSEPFGDMVQRVLVEDLVKRLPHGSSVRSQRNQGGNDGELVSVAITAFEYGPEKVVTLEASWVLAGRSHHAEVVRPATGNTAHEIAVTMSAALGSLADQIVEQL